MNVIDRKKAADLLQVSIRTLDRYISKGILPKQDIGGRIVINYKDLKSLLDKKKIEHEYIDSLNSLSKELNSREQGTSSSFPQQENFSAPSSDLEQSPVYQKLFEQLQEEIKQKQERLEGANYRVGQLEGLLKESVPLVEYRKSLALEQQKQEDLEELLNNFEKHNDTLSQTIEAKKLELDHLAGKLEQEKLNKKVFLIILIILFLLQPLWLLFPPVIN